MMKRLFVAFTLLIAAMCGSAKSIVFTLSDGTLVYYLIGKDKVPVLKFVDGGITINDEDSYTFSQIKNFYLSSTDDPNAIDDVPALAGMSFRSNVLVVGVSGNATVKVFDASGKEMNASVNVADGLATVDLNGLGKGVYVVNTGNASFKLLKK